MNNNCGGCCGGTKATSGCAGGGCGASKGCGSSGASGGCGGCCGGGSEPKIQLNPAELTILTKFAEIPFLPVVQNIETFELFIPECGFEAKDYQKALENLYNKGIVSIDIDFPLSGYDYDKYLNSGFECGSAALSNRGQTIVDDIEILGF